MRFSPQRGAIFRYLNFKKWSEAAVFCAFWLASAFSRQSGMPFFDIVTSKIAPELRCFVHLDLKMCFAPQRRAIFLSLLNTYLRTRRFTELTFRTSGTTNHWKNAAVRDFPNISRVCAFFVVTLLACGSSFFWLDFSTLLCNCPYCRKLDF